MFLKNKIIKNMKKILSIVTIALYANISNGQDVENNLVNFRFGLKITPSINWDKPEGKILEGNGARAKFGGGLILEFRLAKTISIQTGAQIDLEGCNIKFNNGSLTNVGNNSVSYYYNISDDAIVKYSNDYYGSGQYIHYQVNERKYNITYITIPLTLKMKTKEIGSFTYYGQIGVNSSFRWKATADDKVTLIQDGTANVQTLGTTDTKSNIEISKDVRPIHETLNLGLGAEFNLSGTTSLTFGLNYILGFTNVVKNESEYLKRYVADGGNYSPNNLSNLPQTLKSNAVVLTVGVLF